MSRNVSAGMFCEVLPSRIFWLTDYISPYVGTIVEVLDRKVDTVYFRGPSGYTQSADESRFQPVDVNLISTCTVCGVFSDGTMTANNEYGCFQELECPHCEYSEKDPLNGLGPEDAYCSDIMHEDGHIFPHNFE